MNNTFVAILPVACSILEVKPSNAVEVVEVVKWKSYLQKTENINEL